MTPEPERGSTATPGRMPQLVFWGVLGAVVLVLLVLIARLVRNGPAAGTGAA